MRSPSKLGSLLGQCDVSPAVISSNLSIVQGNVKDQAAVSKSLVVDHRVVDLIVFGIGGLPVFKPNPLRPTLDDPTICQDATNTILAALREVRAGRSSSSSSDAGKPLMIVISTTGISPNGRDVPLALVPLYHWMLPIPHADKRAMEKTLIDTVPSSSSPIRGFVVVRASLLTDAKLLGVDKVRVGWEIDGHKEKGGKPAVGYSIGRADVGNWIYERLIKGNEREKWSGKMVTVTY